MFIGGVFALTNNNTEGATEKGNELIVTSIDFENNDFAKSCCRRTITVGDESASVKKCAEHEDSAVAHGAACAAATAAAKRALGLTVAVKIIETSSN